MEGGDEDQQNDPVAITSKLPLPPSPIPVVDLTEPPVEKRDDPIYNRRGRQNRIPSRFLSMICFFLLRNDNISIFCRFPIIYYNFFLCPLSRRISIVIFLLRKVRLLLLLLVNLHSKIGSTACSSLLFFFRLVCVICLFICC